jgi:hypothetical protein
MKPATYKLQIGVVLGVLINLIVLVGGIVSIGIKWGHFETVVTQHEARLDAQGRKISSVEQGLIAHTGKALK